MVMVMIWREQKGGGHRDNGGIQQPNESRRTDREVETQSELTVLFCNCAALTAALTLTQWEREEEHSLLGIIY